MASSTVNDLASSFTIRERTGDQRTVVLRERALPYRPFTLDGKQRNVIEWYGGSPIGTMQVFGAAEDPTIISGAWKDKFLGGSPGSAPAEVSSSTSEVFEGEEALSISSTVVQTARELAAVIDDIRRKGQEIEVTWLNQVRRGVLAQFTQKWQTGHDLDWDIKFDWISQGESLKDVAAKSDASDLGDLPNKVQAHVDELATDVAELVPQSGNIFSDINDALTKAGARLQELTDELTDMVVQASDSVSAPGQAVRRAVGILDGLKMEGELMWSIATDTADGAALDLTETISFGKSLSQRAELRDRSLAAREIRDMAAREASKLLKSFSTSVIRIFQARQGQDLRDVSYKFFGTIDEWRSLMIYNHLTTSQLNAGQVVFVPARPTEDDA